MKDEVIIVRDTNRLTFQQKVIEKLDQGFILTGKRKVEPEGIDIAFIQKMTKVN